VDGQPNDCLGRIKQWQSVFENRRPILRAIGSHANTYANCNGDSYSHSYSNSNAHRHAVAYSNARD
jgi:hypothetical protein